MRRRDFLISTGALATGALASGAFGATDEHAGAAFELRTFRFAAPAKLAAFERFVAEASVPAWNRAGVKPVGVFKLLAKDNPDPKLSEDPNELWVFLPHPSAAAVFETERKVLHDDVFLAAAKGFFNGSDPKSDPPFTRVESMLLEPMTGFPRVATPEHDAESLFELRTYESPNFERHLNKLDMFNAGEFGAFERAGMPGVFFGGAIIASNLPQLTYMILHRDPAKTKDQWAAFQADAEWMKLKANPIYKDNVSKIIRRFVRAGAGSQI